MHLSDTRRWRWHRCLTVLWDLQDVADQGAVAVEGLSPGQVDGPLLRGAQDRYWVFWSVGQLPVFVCVCVWNRIRQERQQIKRIKQPKWEACIVNIRAFDGLERRVVINHKQWRKHPSITARRDVNTKGKNCSQIRQERQICIPDSEVGATGVIASDWGHPAGVCSDVARPRLGDVQGPVGILPQAGRRAHVNHRAALLPHVPAGCMHTRVWETHTHTLCNTRGRVVTVNLFALHQFRNSKNTEGADTDEKPCEADGKAIWIRKPSLSVSHTVLNLSSMHPSLSQTQTHIWTSSLLLPPPSSLPPPPLFHIGVHTLGAPCD